MPPAPNGAQPRLRGMRSHRIPPHAGPRRYRAPRHAVHARSRSSPLTSDAKRKRHEDLRYELAAGRGLSEARRPRGPAARQHRAACAACRLSVDSILSEKVALDAAEPLGIPVFPVVPYGITPYFLAYPGSISLRSRNLYRHRPRHPRRHGAPGLQAHPVVNGHGGNQPAGSLAIEWMADNPGVQVKFHNWWNAPKTFAKVQEIDPVASHASWMENFPWTRLPGVAQPTQRKPMIDLACMRVLDPAGVRKLSRRRQFRRLLRAARRARCRRSGTSPSPKPGRCSKRAGREPQPILIWGAGAIGGTLGAGSVRAGHECVFVDNVRRARRGDQRERARRSPARSFRTLFTARGLPAGRPDRHVRPHLPLRQGAAHRGGGAALAPHLAEDGYVVSAQNGLNELIDRRDRRDASAPSAASSISAPTISSRASCTIRRPRRRGGRRARRRAEPSASRRCTS